MQKDCQTEAVPVCLGKKRKDFYKKKRRLPGDTDNEGRIFIDGCLIAELLFLVFILKICRLIFIIYNVTFCFINKVRIWLLILVFILPVFRISVINYFCIFDIQLYTFNSQLFVDYSVYLHRSMTSSDCRSDLFFLYFRSKCHQIHISYFPLYQLPI